MGTVDRALSPRSDMEQQPAPATCWTNLLETTFNKVNDILGDVCVVEEMMSTEEDMIEQAVSIDLLSDSRLDANSVLIDDIKLGEEANMEQEEKMMPRDRSYSWHGGKLSSSSSSNAEPMDFPLNSCSASPARSYTSSGSGGSASLATVSESTKSMSSCGEEEERGGNSSGGESNDTSKVKLNTRKNPWGNHSYAELIVQAIQSSPEGRLTLAQIYDWMIASVPYFAQRADSSSAAGWKNSIRHNLSLHQRFLKVQNEGAGKSSWWTLNPERKLGAKPRRRATSGDVRSLQQRRDRVRFRNSTERLSINTNSNLNNVNANMNVVNCNENLQTGSREGLSQNILPQTPTSPQGQLLGELSGQPLEEAREPVASRLEGLSLGQEGRHRIKILEPRDQENVPRLPVHNFSSGRPGILQQLEQLTQRQRALQPSSSSSSSFPTNTSLPRENAFDQRIRLLQEELDSMSRDQEILNINQYASVSNNPYFLGVEGVGNSSEKSSSLFTLKPREDRDVMRAALAQELEMIPNGVTSLQSVR